MSTRCTRFLPAASLILAVHAPSAAAQRPGAPTAIPVYPGAVRYEPERAQVVTTIQETLLGLSDGIPLLSSTQETWVAQVTPNKVDAFYRARLGGIASDFPRWRSVDPRTLAPGTATRVHQQRYDDGGTTRYVYHWYRKEPNGDIGLHELAFGLAIASDPRLPQTGPLTMIDVTRKTYSLAARTPAPDEKTLGAPVYPAARYDANASTNTLGALFRHVFLSSDPPPRVVAFFERACGRTALQGAPLGGGVTWVFRPCTQALPDDYIVIEAADSASQSTRISYHLMRDGPPGRN